MKAAGYSSANDRIEQEIRESTEAVVAAISEFYPKEKQKVNIRPEQPHHESAWAEVFKEFLYIFVWDKKSRKYNFKRTKIRLIIFVRFLLCVFHLTSYVLSVILSE